MQKVRFTNSAYIVIFSIIITLGTSCIRKGSRSKLQVDDIYSQQCDFEYFKAKSKVDFANNEQSLSAVMNVRIKQDSAIWLSVSVMLEAVRAVITKDSVYVYQKLPERSYKEYSIAGLSEMTGIELSYSILESAFMGNLTVFDKNEAEITESDLNYTVSENYRGFDIVSIIEKTLGKVTSVRVSDDAEINTANLQYSDYTEMEVCKIPNKINFQTQSLVENDSTVYNAIEIEYTKTKFYTEPINFPFDREKYAE